MMTRLMYLSVALMFVVSGSSLPWPGVAALLSLLALYDFVADRQNREMKRLADPGVRGAAAGRELRRLIDEERDRG